MPWQLPAEVAASYDPFQSYLKECARRAPRPPRGCVPRAAPRREERAVASGPPTRAPGARRSLEQVEKEKQELLLSK